ncbi:MAG: hypothetical protein K2N18_01365, partial [Clostridia bacterium]|nr:hypothetical protein [Clostridia bacterium]
SLEEARGLTEEQAIQKVYDANIPNNISQVVSGWGTAINLQTYLTNAELEIYSASLTTKQVPEIEGIQFANRTKAVTVNGKQYGVPAYNADGSVQSGNEVLAITINNIDPKAIWNFALPIAPMAYYSDKEHVDAFDFETCHFGVEWGSQTFLQEVVNANVGLPMGAGPYAASRSSGGIDNVKSSEFYSDGVIYYEANPYYIQGEPLIKKVRYQVVAANSMLNTLYNKEVDFVEPNAKPEIISELNGKIDDGYGNKTIYTAGYGYIGINAGKVPSLKVRQAIMHAINVKECSNYYGTEAAPLYRSMSKENWAYPEGATPYYPYVGDPVPEGFDGARAKINPDYVAFVKSKNKKAGDVLTQ